MLKSDLEDSNQDQEMKPMDLAERDLEDENGDEDSDDDCRTDNDLSIDFIKKEHDDEDDEEDEDLDEDEDEEIEVDDIDMQKLSHQKKSSINGKGGHKLYYEESATTTDGEEHSNDAKLLSETRLPILKSMLSPVEQSEEKIGKFD